MSLRLPSCASANGPGRARGALALLALVASLLATGCSATRTPPKCPSAGGSAWRELSTRHFVVVTDVDERRARETAKELETMFEDLRAAAFPRVERVSPLTVVVFADDREREAFRTVIAAGEFADRFPIDLESAPTVVLGAARYTSLEADWRRIVLHELTHSFLRRAYGGVPIWLNEGLADYLSTLRVEDGKAILGERPPYYRLTPGFTPTVGQLLSADRDTFYAGRQDTLGGRDARYLYYSGAWALVHFLQNGPDPMRALFQSFVQRLGAGETTADAWRATLGRVPASDFERDYLAYLTAERWRLFERDVHPAEPSPVERARVLGDEEVHLLWARLASLSVPPASPASAETQIAEAERAAPGSAEVSYRRGALALARLQAERASTQFDAALARAPREPRYLYGAAITRERQLGPAGTGDGELRDLADRLAETATSADELTWVALARARAGDDAEAMRRADQAVAVDPSYYRAYVGRALVHFRAARYADAVADQRRAVALAPEQSQERSLTQTLHRYEAVLAGASSQ
jgi:tetratricopeptide (TPR) repeat protein